MDNVWAYRDTIWRPRRPHHSPWRKQAEDSYYVRHHFSYHRDFMLVVAPILVLFVTFLAFMYAVCIKRLNFQQRQEQDMEEKLLRVILENSSFSPFISESLQHRV
jgi:hypothetical protein